MWTGICGDAAGGVGRETINKITSNSCTTQNCCYENPKGLSI